MTWLIHLFNQRSIQDQYRYRPGLENLKEGGLVPATKEQKTVSQILDEIE